MKRRNFCRYIALGSACGIGASNSSLASVLASERPQLKSHHKWVVLYWMPYDNDLSNFGEPIIEMLGRGSNNPETAVVVQSDYYGDAQMRRRLLVNRNIVEMSLTEKDSSDADVFSEYLDWANQSFEADHWIIIVVGHGGKINEVSPDDHGSFYGQRTWMGVDEFTREVRSFNRAIGEKVELLFFQNCHKSMVEVVYEARDCARYTLASQLLLGAPNYYYEGFLTKLSEPLASGYEAAMAIMDSERSDMYHTLTLVDNYSIVSLPDKLSRLLKQMLNEGYPVFDIADLPTYYYFSERHCDLITLLDHLVKGSAHGQREFSEFSMFLKSSVISAYRTGGEFYSKNYRSSADLEDGLCGLGLYFPESRQDIARYSSLALYQAVDLLGMYEALLPV